MYRKPLRYGLQYYGRLNLDSELHLSQSKPMIRLSACLPLVRGCLYPEVASVPCPSPTAALHRLILTRKYVTLLDERVENWCNELSEIEAA